MSKVVAMECPWLGVDMDRVGPCLPPAKRQAARRGQYQGAAGGHAVAPLPAGIHRWEDARTNAKWHHARRPIVSIFFPHLRQNVGAGDRRASCPFPVPGGSITEPEGERHGPRNASPGIHEDGRTRPGRRIQPGLHVNIQQNKPTVVQFQEIVLSPGQSG